MSTSHYIQMDFDKMHPQNQSVAIGAGLCGVAALCGAPGFIVATGCGLLIRECFRNPDEYTEEPQPVHHTGWKSESSIDYSNIKF